MAYRKLFLFLEGNDDEIFFTHLLIDKFNELYNEVQIWKYAEKTKTKRKQFIRTISNVNEWDYICFGDFNSAKCITQAKERICTKFQELDKEKILVVVVEIESWYLAGVNNSFLREIGAKIKDRASITMNKEYFERLIPEKMPKAIFQQKILENYDMKLAAKNNESFKYFIKKYLG